MNWLPAIESTTQISESAAHIWRCRTEEMEVRHSELFDRLSPEEQGRARRFRSDKHREQFVIARGVLRNILGRYLGVPPNEVTFSYSEYGKPMISGADWLSFNVAHSENVCLYGIARRRVGVDVERMRPEIQVENLTTLVLTSEELARIAHLVEPMRTFAFYRCWVRKEACLKAAGKGLSGDPQRVQLSILPAVSISPEFVRFDDTEWTIVGFDPDDGFAGAVAVEGGDIDLTFFHWLPE